MSGAQDYARRFICVECLLPPRCTQTPTVAWLEPGKAKVRHWRGKIIALRFRKRQKRISHHGTNRMTTDILSARVAATVAIKARHRFDGADIERLAEHIARSAPSIRPVIAIIPEHNAVLPDPISANDRPMIYLNRTRTIVIKCDGKSRIWWAPAGLEPETRPLWAYPHDSAKWRTGRVRQRTSPPDYRLDFQPKKSVHANQTGPLRP
jgi:hypothetical protein